MVSYTFAVRKLGQGALFTTLSDNDTRNILLSLFTTAASLMGFVLAAGTFLVSHVRDDAFSVLRRSRSYPQLNKLISSAIWRLFGLSAASLAMLIVGPKLILLAKIAVIYFVSWSGLSLAAMTWIVMQILSIPPKP